MKELSIEEKAKRYEEFIKKAELLYKASEPMSGCNVIIETLLPELKESEDERIRKWLISTLKSLNSTAVQIDGAYEMMLPAISWLKEQGEHANFRNKIQIGDKVTRNEDGVLVNLSQLNRVAKPADKQGEQKPTKKIEPKFKVGDWVLIDNPCQIESIDSNGNYIVRYSDAEETHLLSMNFCDSHFHLWTIHDTKDGMWRG